MQSNQEILDRIQSKVQSLIRKLEVCTEENSILKKEIERLKKELDQHSPTLFSKTGSKEEDKIKKVRDALDSYIEEIETCIQLIKE
jgi:regulator of replication initiation timing